MLYCVICFLFVLEKKLIGPNKKCHRYKKLGNSRTQLNFPVYNFFYSLYSFILILVLL